MNQRIGLIDVDGHHFPNLCLMKLSAFHKQQGDIVEWHDKSAPEYDIVYMAKVFSNAYSPDVPEPINARKIVKGGTGYAIWLEGDREVYHKELDPPLAPEIENIYPDYSLYPEYTGYGQSLKKQTAYGFLTRGCPRGCGFCHVAPKEGRCSHKVADLSQFWSGQGHICLSDPNILACKDALPLLKQLADSGATIDFNQGLDARLITPEKAELLARMKLKTPHFAMDSMDALVPVSRGLRLYVDACKRIKGKWNWRNAKVFCLTNFDTTHEQDMERIKAIQDCECYPYVMIYNKPSAPQITRRLQRWTNNVICYAKSKDFDDYQQWAYKKPLQEPIPQRKEETLKLFVYDFEVFHDDWIGIFKDYETKKFTIIHNDSELMREFIDSDCVYCGFNSKHYDQFIVKAICNGASIEEVKELNDFIIGGGQGWEHPLIHGNYYTFNNIDIKDDMQMGLSLKAIEGHLGMSVQESTVSFTLDRPLTQSELEETIYYCKHDVDTTEKLVEVRAEYLKSKMSVGRMVGLSDAKALSMTNAKLTAALLGAKAHEYTDERAYVYPPNLHKEHIPDEVFAFFDQMHDESISDDDLFKSKLNFEIGGCPCVIGFGGIHGAIPTYQEEAHGNRTIRNYDVASLYPSLMINCGYTSRSIPSAESFKEVYHKRLAAKKSGDKATANALKLVLNTTYGAMLNKYNDLFDPLMGRSVCVSGQLFLMELALQYVKRITTLKLIQLNTDGVMVSLEDWELPILTEINEEWQSRTGFMLEEDVIQRVAQKDVNNYIEIKSDGSVKTKGGYLVRGTSVVGAFNINNNATIVAKAITEYFVHGTPVEETINGCNDIMGFQLIAKAGAKYREAYHLVDDEQQPVQKVNRVYASKDTRFGKLFKVKAENDATAKIEMLPEHCIIDNDNHLTIDDVDKNFYIEMAKKRINDFLGIKPEKKERKKKMATTKSTDKGLNVYQRLALIREKFAEAGITKSGRNMQLKAKYFELDDIVPVAMPLFHEQNLLPMVNFTKDEATMTLLDMLDPQTTIVFTAPMREWLGNAAVTPVQALGATETYMRRYLYQQALDIVEADEMENRPNPISAPAPKAPPTPEQREAVKQELTQPEGNASDLQIKQLKSALAQLRTKDSSKEEWIAKVAIETQGFTAVTKTRCEEILKEVSTMLGGDNA